MRTRTLVILPAALMASLGWGCSQSTTTATPAVCSAPQGEHAAAKTLATADTTFSLALYPKTVAAHGATQNLIVSPYSASAALTMLQGGAAGETATQMQAALELPAGAANIAPAYATLACENETDGSSSGNTLSISNAVWVDQSLTLEKTFQSLLAKAFAAPVQETNFGDPSAAASTIDAWVSNATDGQIPSLLTPSELADGTKIILVNAVYFKGAWANGFDPSMTSPATFTRSDGTKIQVPTMTATELAASAHIDTHLTVLELPYKGDELAMDLLMPTGSLGEFESTLTTASLSAALQSIQASNYAVSLPKFSFKNQINLIPVLQELGMQDAFKDGVADLSGIDGKKDLFVNLVVQQAMVEVDETGTVAAAATAVSGAADAVSVGIDVEIDRPFLFLIRDKNTGSVLFMGRVEDPSQAS